MRIAFKGGVLIAAMAILSLTTACDATDNKPAASDAKAPVTRGEAPAAGADTSPEDERAKRRNGDGAPSQPTVVPPEEIAQFTALAECVRKSGVNVPMPEAGKPWDTSAMDSIGLTPPWSKAMAECGDDWKKLVIGVG